MKKRNKINVWREAPTKENANAFFAKTIILYNKGDYEAALKGFEKLSEFINTDLKIIIIPHIEKCKHVLKKKLTNSEAIDQAITSLIKDEQEPTDAEIAAIFDEVVATQIEDPSHGDVEEIIRKRHLKNQAILKYFGWVDKIKYFTGIASFVFFSLLMGDTEEGTTFSDNFLEHPWFLVWTIVLAILTFLLHKFMKRFTISNNLIRCKYCGRYTPYINPNEPTFGFINENNCSKCGRMYPVPDFYWDGWEGLEYMEHRHSVPDDKFYIEYQELKKKFSKEYNLYINKRKEAEKSEKNKYSN